MKNHSAIIVLDDWPGKKSGVRSKKKIRRLGGAGNSMEVELNRFLDRMAQSKEFDGRQLFLPGFYPDRDTP